MKCYEISFKVTVYYDQLYKYTFWRTLFSTKTSFLNNEAFLLTKLALLLKLKAHDAHMKTLTFTSRALFVLDLGMNYQY
jgi:hypothetical protein